jgi:hypothetical protein
VEVLLPKPPDALKNSSTDFTSRLTSGEYQIALLELTPFRGHLMVLAEGVRSVQTTHPQAALSGAIS